MQALESIEDWDIRAYVRSTARKCGVNIDNLPKGEVVPFVRPLKGVYELSEDKLRECKAELAEVEEAQEQCNSCDGCSCQHKAKWKNLMVKADCRNDEVFLSLNNCKFNQQKYKAQKMKSLMESAQIPVNYRQDTWQDFTIQQGNMRAAAFAQKAVQDDKSLYLWGKCGTGKTKLTSIIANERLKKGLPVLFVSLPELYRGLKANFDKNGSSSELLELVKKAKCLILDDLGASSRTEWSVGILQELIDYRYTQALQTIITSNYSLTELKSYLVIRDKQGNPIEDKQAERITSRLEEMCHMAKLDTKSFRQKQEDILR